jgi:type 1 fimbriae regulatory protein FimE
MATLRLQYEALQQKRDAVVALAQLAARKAVKRQLQAEGRIRPALLSYAEITGDAAATLLAYRHGLRAAELTSLRWFPVDLRSGRMHVNRAKGGAESVHPLGGPELRALRRLLPSRSPYVFVTEQGSPVTTAWFLRTVARSGEAAGVPFSVHPHMLRHACGYKLANDGHDTRSLAHYLGHRNLQSTARYTALAPERFAKFWQD